MRLCVNIPQVRKSNEKVLPTDIFMKLTRPLKVLLNTTSKMVKVIIVVAVSLHIVTAKTARCKDLLYTLGLQ